MVGRINISLLSTFMRYMETVSILCKFVMIFSQFPVNPNTNKIFTIKFLVSGQNLGKVGKPEIHIYFIWS